MTVATQLRFSDDRSRAVAAVESVGAGRGWCNVVAAVAEDVPDLKVNVFGLWVNHGAPVATYVTAAPRDGVDQPSTLGLLHSRGRLGRDRIAAFVGDLACSVAQDHSQRGLLLNVAPGASASRVLDVMCALTTQLCDYEMTGGWRLDLFTRV